MWDFVLKDLDVELGGVSCWGVEGMEEREENESGVERKGACGGSLSLSGPCCGVRDGLQEDET